MTYVQSIVLRSGSVAAIVDMGRGGMISSLAASVDEEVWPMIETPEEDPGVWPMGGIPFLFPFAGRCYQDGRMGEYTWKGWSGKMPLHGFAWKLEAHVKSFSGDAMTVQLFQTEETLAQFPFEFSVEHTYRLGPKKLDIATIVENRSKDPMPFYAGWHPFLNLGRRDLWRLSIPARSIHGVTDKGLPDRGLAWLPNEERQASDPLFRSRIFSDLTASTMSITSGSFEMAMEWTRSFRYLVFWAPQERNSFCVEPWMALPDAIHHHKDLTILAPREHLEIGVSLRWNLG